MSARIVIFDLDGTLADIEHRRHFVEKPNKVDADWRAFYAACIDDKPNKPVVELWRALRTYERWIVSGRSREVESVTWAWLDHHGLIPKKLLMRKVGDHQPDVRLKRDWLRNGTIPKSNVAFVVDDRSSVVAMWREEGLACFQVAPGDF